MESDNSYPTPLSNSQHSSQEQPNSRRMRSNSIHHSGSDKEGHRSRASSTAVSDANSDAARYNKARGTVNDAVYSAIEPVDPAHTAIPPEVLNQITSQITASVLQQLKATQYSPPTTHIPPTVDHVDSTSSGGGSPPIDRNKVYTPPSPFRPLEEVAQPPSPTSPRKQARFPDILDTRRPPTPPFSHGTLSEDSDAREGNLKTTRRMSRSEISEKPTRSRRERTSVVEETDSGDATILEKIWGELFDITGQPTARLSQFLRGVAIHLIDDCEPKQSLVITPDKMQRYYETTRISNEIYPWNVIFDDRTSSISRLLREVEAQHHLVQDRLNERPDIPGLTPSGFETWMVLVLKAHPEEEYERLAKTVLHMPVNNPDDRKERFPKELSRRQFPKNADESASTKLQKVVLTHCGVKPLRQTGSVSDKENKTSQSTSRAQDTYVPPKPAPDYSLSQTTTRSTLPEIDVNALRATVSEATADDSPIEVIPPPQIERERKPYVAQPGGGKNYDSLDAQMGQAPESRQSQSTSSQPPKLTRSTSLNNSNGRGSDSRTRSSQPIAIHQIKGQPPPPPQVEVPQPMRTRTGSVYHRDAPRRGERNRSPSISRTTEVPHKSDGEVSYGSYHSTNSDYAPASWRPDNRYDNHHRGSFSNESRDRDREPRQRYHSTSGGDGHRYYSSKDYPSDEEYYRSGNQGYARPDAQYPPPPSSSQHMPPSSYRSRA